MFEWIQLLAAVLIGGVLLGASISAVVSRLWLKKLQAMAPQPRFALVAALALLPLASGLVALAVVFAPSLLDAHGIVGDHCGDHVHHAFHLCFLHGSPPPVSALFLAGTLAALLLLGTDWAREIRASGRAARWSEQLSKLSQFDDSTGAWVAETNQTLAVTVGLFRPRVFVSTRVREITTSAQLRAVLAHEHAHARRRDGLVKLLVRVGSSFQFAGPRAVLLEELEVASEQACDEAAAHAVGDRLLVAETLLMMRRVLSPLPAATMGFGATALERRVQGMLEGHAGVPRWGSIAAVGIGVFGAIVVSYDELHHAAEAVLSNLF